MASKLSATSHMATTTSPYSDSDTSASSPASISSAHAELITATKHANSLTPSFPAPTPTSPHPRPSFAISTFCPRRGLIRNFLLGNILLLLFLIPSTLSTPHQPHSPIPSLRACLQHCYLSLLVPILSLGFGTYVLRRPWATLYRNLTPADADAFFATLFTYPTDRGWRSGMHGFLRPIAWAMEIKWAFALAVLPQRLMYQARYGGDVAVQWPEGALEEIRMLLEDKIPVVVMAWLGWGAVTMVLCDVVWVMEMRRLSMEKRRKALAEWGERDGDVEKGAMWEVRR